MAKGPLTVLAYSQDDKIKLDEGKLAAGQQPDRPDNGHDPAQGRPFPTPSTSAVAGPAGQCPPARRDAEGRPDRRRRRPCSKGQNGSYVYVIAAGRDRRRSRPVTRCADQRRPGADRLRACKADETVVRRRPVQAPAGQLACACCMARPRSEADLQSAVEEAIP